LVEKAEKIISGEQMNGRSERKNYLLFASSQALERFLKRKICPTAENGIEYCTMERFAGNRILFTAEHAQTKRIAIEGLGTREYVGVGDKNTGVLAKIGAYYLRSAYLIPLFIRTEADASRPPEDLGKGLRLFVSVKRGGRDYEQKTSYVQIHKNRSMLPKLVKYHQTIKKLNPGAIISVHGISKKRKFDLLFGFGNDYECIGGKREAFRFKTEFTNYLDQIFREFGVRANLKIAVSTWRFTGSQNHVLTKHVIEHNHNIKDPKKKRVGLQVELNLRGRVSKGDGNMPTIPYQLVLQALGDFVYKWNNKIDSCN
jgi:hypothetical protein